MKRTRKTQAQKDAEFLRNLADRIMAIPVMYGVDQLDAEQLIALARKIERREK